tara:strand:- start:243 stop:437 length:195 start_codon:yes stop_codon:yes gene_type:complete
MIILDMLCKLFTGFIAVLEACISIPENQIEYMVAPSILESVPEPQIGEAMASQVRIHSDRDIPT